MDTEDVAGKQTLELLMSMIISMNSCVRGKSAQELKKLEPEGTAYIDKYRNKQGIAGATRLPTGESSGCFYCWQIHLIYPKVFHTTIIQLKKVCRYINGEVNSLLSRCDVSGTLSGVRKSALVDLGLEQGLVDCSI